MSRHKIPPTTVSIEELARFWDAHDSTDFAEQLEEVAEPVFCRPANAVVVALQPTEFEAVKRIARTRGIAYDALIREWVLDRIRSS